VAFARERLGAWLDIASYKQGGRAPLAQEGLARNKCGSGLASRCAARAALDIRPTITIKHYAPAPPSPLKPYRPPAAPPPSLAPPPNTTKLVASVGFAPKGLKQTRRMACRRPKKSLTDRSEKGEKRYTLQIFICVQSSRPDHCGTSVNGPGHGSAYQSCVAVALLVINTGADFSTNKNIKTVEP